MDLDRYFDRIAYRGDHAPTLATLQALSTAHVQAIPFENLDVLLGRGISLDDAAVDRKLVAARRGGYCFEHNTLFLRVLGALGFEVRPLSARVRVGRPREFTPPRTHVFVRAEIEGTSWLADVGVGGLSLTAPLRLEPGIEQPTPHETRRLLREGGRWIHQAKLGEEWADVCEFTLEEMPAIDREVANWFTSTHPRSHFRDRLMVARALDNGGRMTLLNRELTVRTRQGVETQRIASPSALLETLHTHFGLEFPKDTVFECPALDWRDRASERP